MVEPNAAGIDVGAREMFVAVPLGRDENPVRVFPTFTEDLEQLANWLLQCGVTTVAMESTGVYGIPLYDVLEQGRDSPWDSPLPKALEPLKDKKGTSGSAWVYSVGH